MWFLAIGSSNPPPKEVQLATLESAIQIDWGTLGQIAVHADSDEGVLTGLGFAHGRSRTWHIILLRQAALGRLSEWFGNGALNVDVHSRRLGLAVQAQEAYSKLDPRFQDQLLSFSAGINASLSSKHLSHVPELAHWRIAPDPWQPWHTLALEQLLMWLATPLPPKPEPSSTALSAFYAADRELAKWLHLHGFENSVAWTYQDSTQTHLYFRYVYGATALPFFLETIVKQTEESPLVGLSMPGLPYFFAGAIEDQTWALLPTGSKELQLARLTKPNHPQRFERIQHAEQEELLVPIWRIDTQIPLDLPNTLVTLDSTTVAVDTTWALRWTGFQGLSDWPVWHQPRQGERGSFALISGNGLKIEADRWSILGDPAVQLPLKDGVFLGQTPLTSYVGASLAQQILDSPDIRQIANDTLSPWARALAGVLIDALTQPSSSTPSIASALTYLNNWDYSFDRASIAASIFDSWMGQYRLATGHFPAASDSLDGTLLLQTLEEGVASLTEEFGDDQSLWRWERVRPGDLYFPVWSYEQESTINRSKMSEVRYAPISPLSEGHPSTLKWGPAISGSGLPSPATWEAWISTESMTSFFVQHQSYNPHLFLGRYRTGGHRISDAMFTIDFEISSSTKLLPPQ